jgi:hypothetical protein
MSTKEVVNINTGTYLFSKSRIDYVPRAQADKVPTHWQGISWVLGLVEVCHPRLVYQTMCCRECLSMLGDYQRHRPCDGTLCRFNIWWKSGVRFSTSEAKPSRIDLGGIAGWLILGFH